MHKNVLIIDDEPAIGSVLSDYLEQVGFNASSVLNLADARAKITEEQKPDVILLDVTLADGNGLHFLEELQGDKDTQDIPVLIMSAHTRSSETMRTSASIVPKDFIGKPFDLRELERRLNILIERKETGQSESGDDAVVINPTDGTR